jgi:hypothetical protein
MALSLNIVRSPVKVNGVLVTATQPLYWWDHVETGAGGEAQIKQGTAVAAVVAGPNSNTTVSLPPTDEVYMWYYNASYRRQLKAAADAVGIRG